MDSESFTMPATGIGSADITVITRFLSAQYLLMEIRSNRDDLVTLCYLIVTIDSWIKDNAGETNDYPEKYISAVLTDPSQGTWVTDAITELKKYAKNHSINLENTSTDLDGVWRSWRQSNKICKGKLSRLKDKSRKAPGQNKTNIQNQVEEDPGIQFKGLRRSSISIKATVWSSKHGRELVNSKHRSQIICEIPDLFAMGNAYNIIRYAGLCGYNVHNPNSGRKPEENLKLKLAPQAMIYSESASDSQNWSLIPDHSRLGVLSYHRENLQVLKARSKSIVLAVVVQSASPLPKRVVLDESKMQALQTLISTEINIADIQAAMRTKEFGENRLLRIASTPRGQWKITAPRQELLPPPPRPSPPSDDIAIPSLNASSPTLHQQTESQDELTLETQPTSQGAQHRVVVTEKGFNSSGITLNRVQRGPPIEARPRTHGNPDPLNPAAQPTPHPIGPPRGAPPTTISADPPTLRVYHGDEAPIEPLHPSADTTSDIYTEIRNMSNTPIHQGPAPLIQGTPWGVSLRRVPHGDARLRAGVSPRTVSSTATANLNPAFRTQAPRTPLPAQLSTSTSGVSSSLPQHPNAQHPHINTQLDGSHQIRNTSNPLVDLRNISSTPEDAPNPGPTDEVGEILRQSRSDRHRASPPTLGASTVTTLSLSTSAVGSSSVTATHPSTPDSSQVPPSTTERQEPQRKLGWVRRMVKKIEEIVSG